jgi:hypothetical protein
VLIRYAMAEVPFAAALQRLMIDRFLFWWAASILVAAMAALLHAAGVGIWILWLGLGQLALVIFAAIALLTIVRRRWREKEALAGAGPSEFGCSVSGIHSRNVLAETRIDWAAVKQVQRLPTSGSFICTRPTMSASSRRQR